MRVLIGIFVIAFSIIFAFSVAMHADEKKIIGEVVNVNAKARLEEMTTGNIENLAYGGKLGVLLQDGQKVDAKCSEDLLSELKGCPKFNTKEINGGFVASIAIDMKEEQKVMLIRSQSNEFEVLKILK